jgi:hypothetical protein
MCPQSLGNDTYQRGLIDQIVFSADADAPHNEKRIHRQDRTAPSTEAVVRTRESLTEEMAGFRMCSQCRSAKYVMTWLGGCVGMLAYDDNPSLEPATPVPVDDLTNVHRRIRAENGRICQRSTYEFGQVWSDL